MDTELKYYAAVHTLSIVSVLPNMDTELKKEESCELNSWSVVSVLPNMDTELKFHT